MDGLFIEATEQLPSIEFGTDGNLRLVGKLRPKSASDFFIPLFNFVDKLEAEDVIFDIILEYFNTPSSKQILELLKHLESNDNINSVLINWHYEEGDEESAEMAEVYEECLVNTQFRYHEYSEMK